MATRRSSAGAASPSPKAPERDLVITRVFDAPRDLVFKAWTEPDRVMRWWAPDSIPESVPGRSETRQGWTELLDRLAQELAKA